MAAEIEARLKITAQDRTAKAFASLEARLKKAQRVADEADKRRTYLDRVEKTVARHQAVAAGLTRTGGLIAGALGGVGAAAAIQSYAALERQMTRVGLAAGATDAETKAATKQVAVLADQFALPLNQAYAGLDALVATGKSLPEAMAFLPSILKTAQATGAATDDMSASANALATSFKIAGGEMQAAFDALVVGGQLGQFELRDMAQYLPSLTASAAKLGFTGLDGTKKLVAMLQTVRQVSGESSEAATAVGDAIEKTLSPTVRRAFKEHGVEIGKVLEDAARKGKNQFEAVIDVLDDMTRGMSDTQRNMFISSIYTDKEARRAVTAMITLKDAYLGYVNAVNNSSGATEKNLNRVLADSQAGVDRLSNSWEKLKNSVGGFLDGAGFTAGANNFADGLNVLNELRQKEQDFFAAVEKGKEGMSAAERWKFNLTSTPEEVRAMAIKGGWKPDPTEQALAAQRDQRRLENDIIASEYLSPTAVDLGFGARPDLEVSSAEREKLLRDHAEAEARRYWAMADAGMPIAPAWLTSASLWSNIADAGAGAGVPMPVPNPLRAIPLPPANPLRASAGLGFEAPVIGGSYFGDVHPEPPPFPQPNPLRQPQPDDNWLPAPPPIEDLGSSADALRDAMESAGGAVKDAGTEAGQAFYDAARRGAALLEQAAGRLEQSLQSGAAAISNVRIQVPSVPAARPGPNANLGQTMPTAGTPGGG